MHKILTYVLLGSIAVLGACASTTEMDPDGQTHWMTRCDENADCGELSCICGVCTQACTANDECASGESVATCQAAATVLDTTSCTTRPAAASVCVPLCEGQSDCNSVASDLACLDNGVCAIEDLPTDQDASVAEEDPPVTGPITPIELACDEDGNLAGTGPFEIVVSGEIGDSLAIAPDGTIFATGTIDTVRNSAFRVVDGEIDPFGMELWEIQRMVIAGDDLITATSNGHEVTIVATHMETGDRLTIAREEVVNALALTADEEAVYWISNLGETPDVYQVWRSPRVPGESTVLADLIISVVRDSLVVAGDDLFFLGADLVDLELFRSAKDGSAITTLQAAVNTGALRSDGQDLFYNLIGEQGGLGNPSPNATPRGIVRMDPVTLESEVLADTGNDDPSNVTLGGPYVYWTTDHTVEDFKPIIKLWRSSKSGGSAPVQLGTLEAYAEPFAEHDGELYWTSTCRIGSDGTTKSHIVRITN